MDILYAKACLYAYPHINKRIDGLQKAIIQKACASGAVYSDPERQCADVVYLQMVKLSLTELKEKIEKALSCFTPKQLDMLDYKYFNVKPNEYYKDFDYKSRAYFREQVKIAKRFAIILEKAGADEEWLTENLDKFIKPYYTLAKHIEESYTKRVKEAK